jgi:repressor LexA
MGQTSMDDADDGDLTPRQRRIVKFIEHCVLSNGYRPTLQEVAMELGLASTSSVSFQLRQLEELSVAVAKYPQVDRSRSPFLAS